MRKILGRAIKWGIPVSLAMWQIKPILNAQNSMQQSVGIDRQSLTNIKETSQRKFTQANQIMQKQKHKQDEQEQEQQEQQLQSEQSHQNDNSLQNSSQPTFQQDYSKNTQQKLQVFAQSQQQPGILSGIIASASSAVVHPNTDPQIIEYLKNNKISVSYSSKVSISSLQVRNKAGDSASFNLQQDTKYNNTLMRLSNFLNPPHAVHSQQQIQLLFKNLPLDQYIIATYIPSQQQYSASLASQSQYNTFHKSHILNTKSIQEQYRNAKYQQTCTKYTYLIIRNAQLAKQLKINTNKVGDRYVYHRSSANTGMEVSSQLYGHKYTIKSIALAHVNSNRDIIRRGLFAYVNQVNYDADMDGLIKKIQVKMDSRKVLLIYSKQKRKQFIQQLKDVLLKVGKIMRQDVIVIYTDNQKLLPKYFQVVPDNFVTVRLLDLNEHQPPMYAFLGLNSQHKTFYSRAIMSGPFNVQNLCKFVKSGNSIRQYYQSKKNLATIKSIVSQQQQMPNNTVVLHWKHGCKGCQLTLSYLEQIKQLLTQLGPQLIYKYEIEHADSLKQVHFRRFNILNESGHSHSKDHDVTPKLKLHRNGQAIDLQLGEIISKIGAVTQANEEQVHQRIIADIINAIGNNIDKYDAH